MFFGEVCELFLSINISREKEIKYCVMLANRMVMRGSPSTPSVAWLDLQYQILIHS